jgi:hypothetical protein
MESKDSTTKTDSKDKTASTTSTGIPTTSSTTRILSQFNSNYGKRFLLKINYR